MIIQKCIACEKETQFEQFSAFPRLCEKCEIHAAEIIAKLKQELTPPSTDEIEIICVNKKLLGISQ